MDRITLIEADPDDSTESESDVTPSCLGLVIVWSRDEPERVGEIGFVPGAEELVLGRGGAQTKGRLQFVAQRLDVNLPRPALEAPGLSRAQLRLRGAAHHIAFERVGQCPVLLDGVVSDHGKISPGSILTIQGQLMLLCVERPCVLPASGHFALHQAGKFGEPDVLGLVGESACIWALREDVALLASARAHVLVTGPSGSGKELVSRAVHRLSARAAGPFVARSAATLPATLVDAELFGNLRNYPNPGMAEREGLVGAAHGGSLFLDEIGELGGDAQAHLLRVLDAAGEYHRLGEARTRTSDLRVVAATNRPEASLKADFAARFDLHISVPGLDERREDLPLLCRHLMLGVAEQLPAAGRFFMERRGGLYPRLARRFAEALLMHRFSLHVRELRELLWRSARESKGDVLECPRSLLTTVVPSVPAPSFAQASEVERIRDVIERHGGSSKRAAAELGLSNRFALYRLMRKHGIRASKIEPA